MDTNKHTPGLYRILTQDDKGNIMAYTKALDPFEIAGLLVCIAAKKVPDARFSMLNLTGVPILLERAPHNS